MKIFRIIIILVLAAVLAAAMWYYRPWSDYSPSKFAALEQADKLTYNFTHMADLVPSRPIKASDSPRPLSNGDVIDVGAITYTFEGQTKTVAEFIEQASVLGLLVHLEGRVGGVFSDSDPSNDSTVGEVQEKPAPSKKHPASPFCEA